MEFRQSHSHEATLLCALLNAVCKGVTHQGYRTHLESCTQSHFTVHLQGHLHAALSPASINCLLFRSTHGGGCIDSDIVMM